MLSRSTTSDAGAITLEGGSTNRETRFTQGPDLFTV
jgi:hypothetical protein